MLCKAFVKERKACTILARTISSQRHIGQPIKSTHPHLIDGDDLTPGISQKEYEDRQLFLLSNLPVGSSVIIGSSSQKYQSWSIPYPYKQNSSFHYLCGIDQPHFLLVLQKLQRNTVRRCLFMKNKPDGKVGCITPHLYPEDAKQYFGISEVYDIDKIVDLLPTLIPNSKTLYTYTSSDAQIHTQVQQVLRTLDNREIKPLLPELDKIRWIKSLNEQKQLRYSSSICSNSFNDLSTIPLIGVESRLGAAFEYNVILRGAQGVSFPTVVAGGSNSQYVQYSLNDSVINPGDNVLIDCGVSINNYQSDLSRVLFAGEQKNKAHIDTFLALNQVYDDCLNVLKTENEWYMICDRNSSLQDIHNITVHGISKILQELGVLRSSSLDVIIEQKLYFKYFPHFTCHYIGLDNNDTPSISTNTPLVPGVSFCIEPGIYFDGSEEIPEELRHFGLRIEDTLLYVDTKSIDILTRDTPRIPLSIL